MGEQAALLDDIAHQAGKLGHLDPVDGGAIDENLAFVNGVELVERFQQGRFPASAGTDQDKNSLSWMVRLMFISTDFPRYDL